MHHAFKLRPRTLVMVSSQPRIDVSIGRLGTTKISTCYLLMRSNPGRPTAVWNKYKAEFWVIEFQSSKGHPACTGSVFSGVFLAVHSIKRQGGVDTHDRSSSEVAWEPADSVLNRAHRVAWCSMMFKSEIRTRASTRIFYATHGSLSSLHVSTATWFATGKTSQESSATLSATFCKYK